MLDWRRRVSRKPTQPSEVATSDGDVRAPFVVGIIFAATLASGCASIDPTDPGHFTDVRLRNGRSLLGGPTWTPVSAFGWRTEYANHRYFAAG